MNAEEIIDSLLKIKKSGRVLDVGCGYGDFAIPLAKLGFEVICIDVSSRALREVKLRMKAENLKIDIIHEDARKFRTDEKFDVVLCLGMLHFLSREEAVLLIKYLKSITEESGVHIVTLRQANENDISLFKDIQKLYRYWDVLKKDSSKTFEILLNLQKTPHLLNHFSPKRSKKRKI